MARLLRPQGILSSISMSVLVLAAVVFGDVTPASARPASPAAAYLAAHPGGRLLNPHEVSYANGQFVVTLPGVGSTTNASPSCPGGWYCFWDEPYFTGRMGKLSSCYGQSLATYGWDYLVASAYYNIGKGWVEFRYGGTQLFQVGVSNRSVANAYPYNWLATDVYRHC